MRRTYLFFVFFFFTVFRLCCSTDCKLEDPDSPGLAMTVIKVKETESATQLLKTLTATDVKTIKTPLDEGNHVLKDYINISLTEEDVVKVELVKEFGEILSEVGKYEWSLRISPECKEDKKGADFYVTVHIIDMNNHKPEFLQAQYNYTMPETFPAGMDLTLIEGNQRIFASDKDLEKNREIKFSVSKNFDNKFTVDTVTDDKNFYAKVKLENSLQKKPDTNIIELEITAEDMGEPASRSTVPLRITLDPMDNRPPVFKLPLYIGRVIDNMNPSKVKIENGPIHASDGDEDIDAPIRYELSDWTDNINEFFKLEKTDGGKSVNLFTTKALPENTRQQGKVAVVVKATQEDNPFRTAYATVLVTLEVPALRFQRTHYSAHITNPQHQGLIHVEPPIKILDGGSGTVTYKLVEDTTVSPGSEYFVVSKKANTLALSVKEDQPLNVTMMKGKVILLLEARMKLPLVDLVARTAIIVHVPQDLRNPQFEEVCYKTVIDSWNFTGVLSVNPAIKATDGDILMERNITYTLADTDDELSDVFSVQPGDDGAAEVSASQLENLHKEGEIALLVKAEEVGADPSYNRYSYALLMVTLPTEDLQTTQTSALTTEQSTTATSEATGVSESSLSTSGASSTLSPEAAVVFDRVLYVASVPEETCNKTVLTVHASGSDITYYISEANHEGYFKIGPIDGVIACEEKVDYEVLTEIKLKVRAINSDTRMNGVENLSHNEALVIIRVLPENDNPPYFTTIDKETNSYIVGYPESTHIYESVPMPVCWLQADDKDSGMNDTIRFSPINHSQFFIDSFTGVVYPVGGHLNCDPNCSFNVEVKDTDGKEGGMSAEVKVVVKLLSEDQISVIIVPNSTVEDRDAVMEKLNSLLDFTVRSLHAQPSLGSGHGFGTSNTRFGDILWGLSKKVRSESAQTGVKLYVYALDGDSVVDHETFSKSLKKALEESGMDMEDFGVLPFTSSVVDTETEDNGFEALQITTIVMGIAVLVLVTVCVTVSYFHIKRSFQGSSSRSKVSPSIDGSGNESISSKPMSHNKYDGPDPNPDGDWCVPMEEQEDQAIMNCDMARLLNSEKDVTMAAFTDGGPGSVANSHPRPVADNLQPRIRPHTAPDRLMCNSREREDTGPKLVPVTGVASSSAGLKKWPDARTTTVPETGVDKSGAGVKQWPDNKTTPAPETGVAKSSTGLKQWPDIKTIAVPETGVANSGAGLKQWPDTRTTAVPETGAANSDASLKPWPDAKTTATLETEMANSNAGLKQWPAAKATADPGIGKANNAAGPMKQTGSRPTSAPGLASSEAEQKQCSDVRPRTAPEVGLATKSAGLYPEWNPRQAEAHPRTQHKGQQSREETNRSEEPQDERERKKSILKNDSLEVNNTEKEESPERKKSVVHFLEKPTVIPSTSPKESKAEDEVEQPAEDEPGFVSERL